MLRYRRMPIEEESPEEIGYGRIRFNLAESSMPDRKLGELPVSFPAGLLLQYTDHRGDKRLREVLAAQAGLSAEDVMVTHGAVGALFIIHTCILGPDDRLLVVRPNYATNLETPFAIGCAIDYFDLKHEDDYKFDVDDFVDHIKPDTKLISITTPHNPTGRITSTREIHLILAAMKSKAHPSCYLLVDETYKEMVVDRTAEGWACSLDDKVVSVSSMSKTYGVPGIRIGWIYTRNKDLQYKLLAAKEQIAISGSVLDEELCKQLLMKKNELLPSILAELGRKLAMVTAWLTKNEDIIQCALPEGGAVCFPRIRESVDIDVKDFYQRLFEETGTIVGPGHWFARDDRCFRLGFGWPSVDELECGLRNLETTIRRMQKRDL